MQYAKSRISKCSLTIISRSGRSEIMKHKKEMNMKTETGINAVLLATISFSMFALTSYSAFAGDKLPNPAGRLKDAKIELCDGKSRQAIVDKYFDAIDQIDGVDGFGGSLFLSAEESPFGVSCACITFYIDRTKYKSIHAAIGDSLDGQLVVYTESGGPGEAQ